MPRLHDCKDLFRRAVSSGFYRSDAAPKISDGSRVFFRGIFGNRFYTLNKNRFVYQRQQKRFRFLPALRRNLAQFLFLAAGDFESDCH